MTTESTPTDQGKPQYVRSVRFTEEQWHAILTKAAALDLSVGRFIRNAALAYAGAETDAHKLRKTVEALELLTPGVQPAAAAAKAQPAKKPTKKNGKR